MNKEQASNKKQSKKSYDSTDVLAMITGTIGLLSGIAVIIAIVVCLIKQSLNN
jgi:hypothetical protein